MNTLKTPKAQFHWSVFKVIELNCFLYFLFEMLSFANVNHFVIMTDIGA